MEGQHFGDNLGLGVRKGSWSMDEDLLLTRYIQEHGEGNWHLIPKTAGLNRCRKSCRLRWLNYLSPHIKRGHFADDEIDLIAKLHKLLGNRWSLIAGRIPGRTANDVKNFWNIHMKNNKLLYYSSKRDNILPKIDTSNKIEVIRPRVRRFSKNLEKKFLMVKGRENFTHNTSHKTKEVIHPNQSKATQPEDEHAENNGILWNLKSPFLDQMDMINTSNEDVELRQDLSTSVLNTTMEFNDTVSLEQLTLPQLNMDWTEPLWENMDIWNLF